MPEQAPIRYDAAYFASRLGLEAWGVDISSAAIEAAKAVSLRCCHYGDLDNVSVKFWTTPHAQFVAAMPNPPNNVEFKALDFFNFDLPSDGKKFILAYDYTFFCAIPPAMREAWGKRYAELVSTGGVLLCLIFPIDGDRAGGPPYSVSADAYRAVLEPAFKCVIVALHMHDDVLRASVQMRIPREAFTPSTRKGRQRINECLAAS